jgi:hypothetical protein
MDPFTIEQPYSSNKVPKKIVYFDYSSLIAIKNQGTYDTMKKYPLPIIHLPDCCYKQCPIPPGEISIQSVVKEPYETVNLNRNIGETPNLTEFTLPNPPSETNSTTSAQTKLLDPVPHHLLKFDHLPADLKIRAETVFKSKDFQETTLFREQVELMSKGLCNFVHHSRASLPYIAKIFGIKHPQTIKDQNEKFGHSPLQPGRPAIFNTEVRNFIIKLVKDRYAQRKAITIPELIEEIQYAYHIDVKQDTLRHFIHRTEGVRMILGVPKEEERVMSSDEDIASYYSALRARLERVPAAFVFNVDETGCSKWTDKRELHVVVPDEEKADQIDIGVDRNCKRHTLTACIAGDGAIMRPFIIVNCKTIDRTLILRGHGKENVMFVHQAHAFMKRALFDIWMEQIFIPALIEKKALYND